MKIFLVICYIYAGLDPGMNPSYVPEYHVYRFDKKEQLKSFIMDSPSFACDVYESEPINYTFVSKKVKKEITEEQKQDVKFWKVK